MMSDEKSHLLLEPLAGKQEPHEQNLSWCGVTYDVTKKGSLAAKEPASAQFPGHTAWEPCTIDKLYPDGRADVDFGNGRVACVPSESVASINKKRILKGVAGNINQGRLCAIMGPSGAGKSSLLNLLAGRVATGVNGAVVNGKVMLDGKALKPNEFRSQVAYVMQEDALFATQTPVEALQFSALLRNPDLSAGQRNELVAEILRKLRLEKCRDTLVGSALIPGLSGGEKKRTAVGVELVSNPKYLFLDEPTSGLDSYAAWMVVDMLRQLANGEYDGVKRTVVATIHQPSSEVFQLFDDSILLSNGRTVYNGPTSNLQEHFAKAGYPIPPGHNPADHTMFCMQLEDLSYVPSDDSPDHEILEHVKNAKISLADYWLSVEDITSITPSGNMSLNGLETQLSAKPKAPFMTQFFALGFRELANVKRDTKALFARFGTTIFLNLLVGIVFQGIGSASKGYLDSTGLNSHFGALGQIAIGGMFGISQPILLHFPLEKPVFLREYAAGTYNSVPYFASKLMVEIPMSILQSGVIILMTYFTVELQGDFLWLVLGTALLGLVASSTAMVIGAIASNTQVAIQMAPILFVPQFLFAGIFIPTSLIPDYLSWAQYLCSLKYGINLLTLAEFADIPDYDSAIDNELAHNNTQALFDRMDIKKDLEWAYFGIMCAVFVVFRGIACTVLARKGKTMTV